MKARYPFPDLNVLPEDIRARILEVQEKAGFIPNVFLALARRPAEWRAFFAYHDALMLKEGGSLTKGEREMIVTATSAANQCLYCVVAHGAILRIYEKKPMVADQVAVNYPVQSHGQLQWQAAEPGVLPDGAHPQKPLKKQNLHRLWQPAEVVQCSALQLWADYLAAAVRSAASMVLTSSMVMVMGPTPPGTGVM